MPFSSGGGCAPARPFAPFLNDVFRLCRHPNGKTRIFSQINYNPPALDLSILYLKKVQNILQTDEICQFFAYFRGVRPFFARFCPFCTHLDAPFCSFSLCAPFAPPPCPSFYAPFSIFMSSRAHSASFPSSSQAHSASLPPSSRTTRARFFQSAPTPSSRSAESLDVSSPGRKVDIERFCH